MTPTAPAIYAPKNPAAKISIESRIGAAILAITCLAILIVARLLPPSPTGVGTHLGLGLDRCAFLDRTGLPCPSCGMTTSFSHFAHGQLLASFYVQPMGAILAVMTVATFWIAIYIAITGKPALRLMRIVPAGYYFIPLMFFAIAAWGWKIFIHLHGIDGWR